MDKKRGLQVVPASPVLPENLIAREDAALWLHSCIRQEQQAEECLLKGIAAESESFYRGSLKSRPLWTFCSAIVIFQEAG